MAVYLDVDPAGLHLPSGRQQGADPAKYQRQLSRYGRATNGMPPLQVTRGSDGELMINDGVTRATRVAKLLPGQKIRVEVIDEISVSLGNLPTVKDKI
jgi:hypothetical protein